MIGICNVMTNYHEVWIGNKNDTSETKYGFAEKKMMGVHYKKRDPHKVWIWKKRWLWDEVWICREKNDGYL